MLASLPETDLLSEEPDADGIDLWADNFSWDSIPGSYGCYAFYDPKVNETVYIGSACAVSHDVAQRGLRMRLRFYRGRGTRNKPTSTIQKVRNEYAKRKLLLRCWISENIGDCRKYEHDAIEKHKPLLNWIGTRSVTYEEHKDRKRKRSQQYRDRMAGTQYNPNKKKRCPHCKKTKKCSEYAKNRFKKLGVKSHCKQCEREKYAQQKGRSL